MLCKFILDSCYIFHLQFQIKPRSFENLQFSFTNELQLVRRIYLAHYIAASRNLHISGEEVLKPLTESLENKLVGDLRRLLERDQKIGSLHCRDFVHQLHVECQTALGRVRIIISAVFIRNRIYHVKMKTNDFSKI